MASRRRALVLEIVADTKKSQKAFGRFSSTLKRFAGGIAAVFAFDRITRFVTDAVSAASNLEESANAVSRAYGAAAIDIEGLGRDAAQELGLSRNEVNELATSFSGFATQLSGKPAEAFEKIITRAADFASVFNIDVDEAMRKFQSGLAGQSEPLRAYGIDVSAAAVNTFAYANGIAEAGAKLTETEKVQARYGLILSQTAFAAGDFAATSDSLANSQRRLGAEWENLQAAMGRLALPVVAEGFGRLADLLDELPARANRVEQVMSLLDSGFARFGNSIGVNADAAVEFTVAFERVERVTGRVLADIRRGVDPLESMQVAMAGLGTETGLSVEHFDELAEGVGATDRELLIAATRLDALNQSQGTYTTTINGTVFELGGMTEAQQRHSDVTLELWERTTMLSEASGLQGTALEKQAAQYQDAADAMEEAWRAQNNFIDSTEEATDELGPLERILLDVGDAFAAGDRASLDMATNAFLGYVENTVNRLRGMNAEIVQFNSLAIQSKVRIEAAESAASTARSRAIATRDAARAADAWAGSAAAKAATARSRSEAAYSYAVLLDAKLRVAANRAAGIRNTIILTPIDRFRSAPLPSGPTQLPSFNVTVNTGVGDPVAIGREVAGVLKRYRGAGGR